MVLKYFRLSGQKLPHKERNIFSKVHDWIIDNIYEILERIYSLDPRCLDSHLRTWKSVALNLLCRSYALEAFMEVYQRARNLKIFNLLYADLLDIGLPDLAVLDRDYSHSCKVHNTGNEAESQLAWWSGLCWFCPLLVRSAMKIQRYRYLRAGVSSSA